MPGSRILLIVGGGIAAFKIPELIRMLRREGLSVTPVLTSGGAEFVTPLTLSALAEAPCHTALFDLTRESEMGHIQLSRNADLVVVAPATADLMARMAAGMADDLATTLLLATDKPVLAAPAMNVRMWNHPATRRNRDLLEEDGIRFVGPDEGDMACGEYGPGRMAEPEAIRDAILAALGRDRPLRLPPEAVVSLPPAQGRLSRAFSTCQSATAAAITAASAGKARSTASRICRAVSTRITSTPSGGGTSAGPVTKLTRAPRSRSAAAMAVPCAPLERLAI